MGKHKNKVLKRGIPTGEECIRYTNTCLICGKRRPNEKRILEHRYDDYNCRCVDGNGRQLSSKDGERKKCTKPAINNTTKCYRHGGASLRGEAHPNFKTGRYSKVVPLHLREAYERSINDDKLTQLHEQLALCDVRERELVEQLGDGSISDSLRQVNKLTTEMEKRLGGPDPDPELARKTFMKLKSELNDIRDNEATWRKIHENMERRRSLAETENRHRERLQGVVLPEQLIQFQMQVVRILKEVLTDRVLLNEVADKLRAVIGGGPTVAVKAELQPVLDAEVLEQ